MSKTILIILRASLIAGLLTLWFPYLQNRWQELRYIPFPGSPQLWQRLLGEDINPDLGEGTLKHAWLLGPLFLSLNAVTWLPLIIPVVYVFQKRRRRKRALGAIVLLAGIASTVAGSWKYLPFVFYTNSMGVHLSENCFVFFALLPAITLGLTGVLEGYRILKTPDCQPSLRVLADSQGTWGQYP